MNMISRRILSQCVRSRTHSNFYPVSSISFDSSSSPKFLDCLKNGPKSLSTSILHDVKVINRSIVTVTKTHVSDNVNSNNTPLSSSSTEENKSNTIASSNGQQHEQNNTKQASLTITESCTNRIKHLLKTKEQPSNYYLRIYVDAGGCSGFQYKFEIDSIDNFINEEDMFLDNEKLVVVDKLSLDYINGSKVDYVQELIKSSFVIVDNPQSESACGCGSSFAVKRFEEAPALD